jgi:hypothetical protein
MISFLSRTIDFFFFFPSLWIYLWLAETSQQPISQTTWLKVTLHCNHCNHFRGVVRAEAFRIMLSSVYAVQKSRILYLREVQTSSARKKEYQLRRQETLLAICILPLSFNIMSIKRS